MNGSEKQITWAISIQKEFLEKLVAFQAAIQDVHASDDRYFEKTGKSNGYKEDFMLSVSLMEQLKDLVSNCTNAKILIGNGLGKRWAAIDAATEAVKQRDVEAAEKKMASEVRWLKK